ncbi:MAG: hypothetical protein AB7O98_12245 [Hyphomonadaceae bacterium]
MSADVQAARDDLAYMRALVGGSGALQSTMGEAFMWAGVLYGGQCLMHGLQEFGLLPWDGLIGLAIALGPTLVFCVALGFIIVKDRNKPSGGVASRAMAAVFQGAGLANLVMAFVFGFGAHRVQSIGLWLYQPIVVCMFQGVAWYVAWMLVRRAWVGVVALGWFAMTVTLGVVISNAGAYLTVLGVGLFVLMAIPGYAIWRGAKAA